LSVNQIRQQLGLSQNELLDRLGFSEQLFRSNISQYERGARVPSPVVLLQYARLAKVDLAVLIDDGLELPDQLPSALTENAKSVELRRQEGLRFQVTLSV
jgi:transcriptional regulator with XRE-family HTH domain